MYSIITTSMRIPHHHIAIKHLKYDDSTLMKTLAQPEDRIQAMLTVPNVQLFAPCSTIYKCPFASHIFHSRYKNDKDNILYGCPIFRDYFDGDGCERRRKLRNCTATQKLRLSLLAKRN